MIDRKEQAKRKKKKLANKKRIITKLISAIKPATVSKHRNWENKVFCLCASPLPAFQLLLLCSPQSKHEIRILSFFQVQPLSGKVWWRKLDEFRLKFCKKNPKSERKMMAKVRRKVGTRRCEMFFRFNELMSTSEAAKTTYTHTHTKKNNVILGNVRAKMLILFLFRLKMKWGAFRKHRLHE